MPLARLVLRARPGNLVLRLNFYSSVSYILGGAVMSLDDIEHGVLRGNRAALLKPGLLGDTHFAQVRHSCMRKRVWRHGRALSFATLKYPHMLAAVLTWCTFHTQDDPRCALSVPLDPRIHFALNCGARGCPPIRYYEADALDERLDLVRRREARSGTELSAHTGLQPGVLYFA